MRSVSVTLELYTANAVLDFLLDTFVFRIMPQHLPERHDCGRLAIPQSRPCKGFVKSKLYRRNRG